MKFIFECQFSEIYSYIDIYATDLASILSNRVFGEKNKMFYQQSFFFFIGYLQREGIR